MRHALTAYALTATAFGAIALRYADKVNRNARRRLRELDRQMARDTARHAARLDLLDQMRETIRENARHMAAQDEAYRQVAAHRDALLAGDDPDPMADLVDAAALGDPVWHELVATYYAGESHEEDRP